MTISKQPQQGLHSSKDAKPNTGKTPWEKWVGTGLVALLIGGGGILGVPIAIQKICGSESTPALVCPKSSITYAGMKVNGQIANNYQKAIPMPAAQPIEFEIQNLVVRDPYSPYDANPSLAGKLLYKWQYVDSNNQRVFLQEKFSPYLELPSNLPPGNYRITAEVTCDRCKPMSIVEYVVQVQPPASAPPSQPASPLVPIDSDPLALEFLNQFLWAVHVDNPAKTPETLFNVFDTMLSPNYRRGDTRYQYRQGQYQPTSIDREAYKNHYLDAGFAIDRASIRPEQTLSGHTVFSVMMRDTHDDSGDWMMTPRFIHLIRTGTTFQVECIVDNANSCMPVNPPPTSLVPIRVP